MVDDLAALRCNVINRKKGSGKNPIYGPKHICLHAAAMEYNGVDWRQVWSSPWTNIFSRGYISKDELWITVFGFVS